MKDHVKICPNCGDEIEGRVDKKFCSPYCKSAFHYKKNRDKKDNLFKNIDDHLKLNRRILKAYNKAGKATVRKEVLLKEGFFPKYFTHYWKTKNGNLYLFAMSLDIWKGKKTVLQNMYWYNIKSTWNEFEVLAVQRFHNKTGAKNKHFSGAHLAQRNGF